MSSQGHTSGSGGSRHRFSADEKYLAVRRVLGGDEVNRVAAEIRVPRERLERWEREFLEGGRKALAERREHSSFLGRIGWRRMAPWVGLLLLMAAVVYLASRFLQTSEP